VASARRLRLDDDLVGPKVLLVLPIELGNHFLGVRAHPRQRFDGVAEVTKYAFVFQARLQDLRGRRNEVVLAPPDLRGLALIGESVEEKNSAVDEGRNFLTRFAFRPTARFR